VSKWDLVSLKDVCIIITDGVHNTPILEDSGIPLLDGADIFDMKINNDNPSKFISNATDIILSKRCKPHANDILISSRGSIGKIAIVEEGQNFNIMGNIILCRPKENVLNSRFTAYYILKNTNKLKQTSRGSSQKGLYLSQMRKFQIPLPAMDVQKNIAQTLDIASELIALRKKQLAELDNLIKATFYDMFGDPVVNEKRWKVVSLRAICNKITDGTHKSPENLATGNYMYITAKHIKRYGIDIRDMTYVSVKVHDAIYSRCNPEYGDLLYIKDGVTTGIAQINTLKLPFSMLSSVALLKQNKDLINNYYLREVLNNETMYRSIRSNMGGAAITRLTLVKISNIRIPLPPIQMQNQFAEIVIKIEEQKALVQTAINESQYLFDSLMSQYFE